MGGIGAGVVTVLAALLAPAPLRAPVVGVLLGVAAGVYPGFALRGASAPELRFQWLAAIGFAAIAVVGIGASPWWLAGGWVLHAAWDGLHHTGRHGAWVPARYPMFCLSYDLVLAAFATYLATGGSSGAAGPA